MKVLFVTRCYPPATGGMERFAHDLHGAISKKTDTLLLSWGGSKKALVFVMPYFFVRSFWYLLRGKVDVIHAQDGVVSILLASLAMLFKKPLVVVIHGLDVTYKSGLYQKLIKWSLGRAKGVVCISSAAKAEVVGRGIDAEKVVVIPLGITDEQFMDDKKRAKAEVQKFVPKLQPNTKLILSVGRLVKRKGVDWFVTHVLPSVAENNPDVLFVVSGEGAWRPSIEAAIETSNMQDHVLLMGRSSDEQLKYLYNAADCFVMPNITVPGDMEGFGRVLLEAALCETPVVASGIEGIVDAIIDNQNGVLLPELDDQQYVKTVLDILNNVNESSKAGVVARKYTLAHYNWQAISDRYVELYNLAGKDRAV